MCQAPQRYVHLMSFVKRRCADLHPQSVLKGQENGHSQLAAKYRCERTALTDKDASLNEVGEAVRAFQRDGEVTVYTERPETI